MSKKITYNKLIRDRIPEIIEASGKSFEVRKLADVAYKTSLRNKLLEEGQEVLKASDKESLVEELADVLEVFEAVLKAEGLSLNEVKDVQLAKREERGGFEGALELVWVKQP